MFSQSFKKVYLAGLVLLCIVSSCSKSKDVDNKNEQPIKPIDVLKTADSVLLLDEKPSAMKEATRLAQSFPASDFSPTGFYLPPNTSMTLSVSLLKGNRTPAIMIGTYSRYKNKWNPTVKKLNAGINTIIDADGGLLYLVFTNDIPTDQVSIKFFNGMRPVPYFQLGRTTQEDWVKMVDSLNNVPDVQLVGDKTMITFSLENAKKVKGENLENLIKRADRVIAIEDSISGLFGSDPLDQPNVHKYLLTESDNPDYYMAATYYRTWYRNTDAVSAILRAADFAWGPWHELGHMHQQGSWTWGELTEVTVNVYSLAVEKALGYTTTRLTSQGEWTKAKTYLAKSESEKDFNNSSVSVWTRLCMFQQLKLAFGDSFCHSLHRNARREANRPSSTDAKIRWFMLNACTISGKDLSSFFKKWGFKLSSQSITDAAFTDMGKLNLPAPDIDLTLLTD